jgi:hypothetical protein
MEPRVFDGQLVLAGMPGTMKFRDLEREPRFCLHTATIDTQVTDGDVKLWGSVVDVRDADLHRRFAEDLFEQTGFDIRGQEFGHYYVADLSSASAVEVRDGNMDVTIWKVGEPERVVRKH